MTYHEKTMTIRFLEHFLEHVDNEESQVLLQSYYDQSLDIVKVIEGIFQKEGAVLPDGFTEKDVNKGAPKLFDFMYDVMYLHLITKVVTVLYSLYSTMSYRADIRQFYRRLTVEAQEAFDQSTNFLLDKGVLTRPPYVSMPKEVKYVQNKDYVSGLNIFKGKRSLNTVEISLIHHAIETNLTGMQLMIGFAQVAQDKEVKNHLIKGMKLSKEIEMELGEFLRDSYIEPPATHAGKATTSTIPPFSDKIMLYHAGFLSTFGLGSNGIGTAFSLRNDLPLKMLTLSKDIFAFAKEGGEIMIKKGWMEEPPQAEDRNKLTKI